METVERMPMSFLSDEKVETTTSPDICITKSPLGMKYMPLVLEAMEGMHQQLMDDGLISKGHVTCWGLVQPYRQTEVFTSDCASTVSETTRMCQQHD